MREGGWEGEREGGRKEGRKQGARKVERNQKGQRALERHKYTHTHTHTHTQVRGWTCQSILNIGSNALSLCEQRNILNNSNFTKVEEKLQAKLFISALQLCLQPELEALTQPIILKLYSFL